MDQSNKNANTGPKMPPGFNIWTSWSVMLGATGIIANGCCCMLWNLPAGIFFGIAGVASAALSKKGEPFTKQGTLGLILSIIAIVIGVIMFALVMYSLYLMRTNPEVANLAKEIYKAMEAQLQNMTPGQERIP